MTVLTPSNKLASLQVDALGRLKVALGSAENVVADPSGTIGLAAVNGTATTALRSDGRHALSQAIAPTWTGNHIFAPTSGDTRFTVGKLGIGASTPTAPLTVSLNTSNLQGVGSLTGVLAHFATVDGTAGRVLLDAYGSGAAAISFRNARGTAAAPTATQLGDSICRFAAIGYGATGYSGNRGQVSLTANENWTDTAQGCRFVLDLADNGGTTALAVFRVEGNSNVILGRQIALDTTATDGFTHIPTCAGTPTGTPTGYTGKVAMVYDTAANKLWIYNGAWKASLFL